MEQRRWAEELRALKRFRQTFWHALVPPNWKPNPRLAKWLAPVRGSYGDLSLTRAATGIRRRRRW